MTAERYARTTSRRRRCITKTCVDKLQKRDVTKVCADKLQKRDGRKIRVDKLHNCDVLVTVTSQIRAYTSCRSVIVKIRFFLPSRY